MDVFKLNEQQPIQNKPAKAAESQTLEIKEERLERRKKLPKPIDEKYLKDPRVHKNNGPLRFNAESVRMKVHQHTALKDQAAISAKAKSKARSDAKISEMADKTKAAGSAKAGVAQEVPKSDIEDNDPNAPMTREKLSGLLGKGALGFDSKTKDVLHKILNG